MKKEEKLTKEDYKFIQRQLERDLNYMDVNDDNWEHRANLKNMIRKVKNYSGQG